MALAAKAASFSVPERPFSFETGIMPLTVPSGLPWIVIRSLGILCLLEVDDSCGACARFFLSARRRVLGTLVSPVTCNCTEESPNGAGVRWILRGSLNSPKRVFLFRELDLTRDLAASLVSLGHRSSMEKLISSRGSDL